MEKEKTQRKAGRYAGFAALSYLIISVIAGVLSVMRVAIQGEQKAEVNGFVVFEFLLIPVLFLLAGYVCSVKGRFEKLKAARVLLAATGFSVLLLVMWYVLLDVYVVLNLPVAEGSYMIDLFLRKTIIVKEYVYLYLSETNGYRYVILPLIHFVIRIIYWLLFLGGNRIYTAKQGEAKKSKRK